MSTGGWQTRLVAAWWSPRTPPAGWRALEGIYRCLTALRRQAYQLGWRRAEHPGVPVIVVGNLVVGGAGKTPTTLALLQALAEQGWHPGVVSRGHGSTASHPRRVHPDSQPSEVGDEPLLMARRTGLPVWVGHRRAAVARALRQHHPEVDVLVCDDGLQHWALARDAEWVVFDGRGIGNGHCLPAGPLREPVEAPSFAARRWVLYNDATPLPGLPGHRLSRALVGAVPLADWHEGRTDSTVPLAELTARAGHMAWCAVAGIASPQRFFTDLAAAGLAVQGVPAPDHDAFQALPWPTSADHVLVTEKDAVKLTPARVAADRPGCNVWVVPMRLMLPASLVNDLSEHLRTVRVTPPAG